jgi:methyl-accepting chemotaxis protein
VESMRRGVVTSSRAIAEQSTSGEQISKEAERLSQMVMAITQSMREQSANAGQITEAVQNMQIQSEQLAKAMAEQARAVQDMNTATRSIAKQVSLIRTSNLEHSGISGELLASLESVRQVADRNAEGVQETLEATTQLAAQAQALAAIVDRG